MNWEIAWSRQSRGYTLLTLFVLLAAVFLWRYLQERRWRDLIIAAGAYVLAFLSHQMAVAFLPALGFIFVAYLASTKLKRLRTKHALLLTGGLVLLTWIGLTAMVRLSPLRPVGYISEYRRPR